MNNYNNVKLEKKAISNKNGKTKLFLSDSSGHHRIFPSEKTRNDFVEVEMVRINDYLKNNERAKDVSFIKIDVEGAELQVLQGLSNILEKNKKLTIMIEFIPSHLKEFGSEPKDVLDILIQHDFKIHLVNYENQKLERIKNIEYFLKKLQTYQMKNLVPPGNNLICIKN